MTRGRSLLLTLALAAPAVLLAAGWLASSQREREARREGLHVTLMQTARSVQGAIDESLDELRRREDERPFYLYNHWYVPPEILAISDPIAVSPLASESSDARLVGYFQIDPDGTVRTPYAAEPGTGGAREARVRALLGREALAFLADEVRGREPGALVARAEMAQVEGEPTQVPPARASRARVAREADAGEPRLARADEVAPDGPLTLALDSYGAELANDLNLAQQGDYGAYSRAASRGRQVPLTQRRTVDGSEQQASSGSASSSARVVPQASSEPTVRRAPRSAPRPQAEEAPDAGTPLPPMVSGSTEVDYTPMELARADGVLVLHRVVSHEGAAVVQGVLLDEAQLVDEWVPEVIARHVASGPRPRVVRGAEASACAVAVPASALLGDVALCFDERVLASELALLDAEGRRDVGLLLALLVVVSAAAIARERAARREAELSRQKSAFVSAVSHELRTPLTTLRMHAEMLESELVDDERRPRVHAELVTETVRLSRLVENVLEATRLEEGRRPIKLARGDLRAHVADVLAEQRALAERRGFELVLDPDDEPIEGLFDAQAVEQIVVNTIDNALKYAREREPRRIELRVARAGAHAVIRVRDHGPGIPAALRERVFERFYRVERDELAHTPGTGLGLALVRELARAHGGDARVADPEDGEGGLEVVVTLDLRERAA